jgi:VanZ family protein
MWISRRQAAFVCVLLLVLFCIGGVLPGSARDDVKVFFALGNVEPLAHYLLSAASVFFLALATRRVWLAVGVTAGLGGLIEFFQFWVPGRSSTWVDLGLDVAGVLTGVFVVYIYRYFERGHYG